MLAIRVNHSDAPTNRWYSGSGIYRHVWLMKSDPLHVGQWGTYVTTPELSATTASIRIRTTVQNEYAESKSYMLTTRVLDSSGQQVAEIESSREIQANGAADTEQTIRISNPALWTIDQPRMYTALTTVKVGKQVCDTYRTPFGIREVRFDPQRGLFLNGQSVKIKGICAHHDMGCLGAAVPLRGWQRRLETLKSIGCNAIRMSHNPPSPELLDLCDHMGFLVMDEAFDKWKAAGAYGRFFDEWWQRDLDAMVLRDRNHPSVIIWSVGNEVGEQGLPEGVRILKQLTDRVRSLDPTRPVTYAAVPDRKDRCVNNNGFAELLDLVSYNYQEQYYEQDKREYPNRVVLGSESYPFFRPKGAVGTVREGRFEFAPVNTWYDVVKHDWVVGQFIWSGIDYIGESVGWPSKGWCNGIIDTCGFLKTRAGFHRAAWRTDPVVQIAVLDDALDIDHGRAAWSWPKMARCWNYPIKDVIQRIQTFTNCQTVELQLDGDSFGVRAAAAYPNSTIDWCVPYRKGKLVAIGSNNGKAVVTDELQTSGPPARILLKPDRTHITADGQDICNIEVNILDEKGVLVPNDDRKITFTVDGAGKLAGTDNGDLRCSESYKGNQRTTRWGRCLLVVQASRQPGDIHIRAEAANLLEATLKLKTKAITAP